MRRQGWVAMRSPSKRRGRPSGEGPLLRWHIISANRRSDIQRCARELVEGMTRAVRYLGQVQIHLPVKRIAAYFELLRLEPLQAHLHDARRG
jgi:hypothetical protein